MILLITVLVINYLFSIQHERINKQKEKDDYKEILKESHNGLVFMLEIWFSFYVRNFYYYISNEKYGCS